MTRLAIDGSGRLVGNMSITYNTPFPTHNGSNNFQEPAQGMVSHTEVGYEPSVINEFNDPSAQASAFFSIGMDGHIHQYGPVGTGWKAWTQMAGNSRWRGVEHEDHGDPSNSYTPAQLEASAAILEALSHHDGFPLQATSDPVGGAGNIFHSDGGAAWGGHDCPGDARRAQRSAVIARAQAIRGGAPTPSPHPSPPPVVGAVSSLQQAVHQAQDGRWGPGTDAALQSVRHRQHNTTEQAAVGAAVDGQWGPASARAEDITTHRIQAVLGVVQDGSWGPTTDRAFLALRARYHR
jgi:hypothetical protein